MIPLSEQEKLRHIAQGLRNENSEVRTRALQALVTLSNPAVPRGLLFVSENDPDPAIRELARRFPCENTKPKSTPRQMPNPHPAASAARAQVGTVPTAMAIIAPKMTPASTAAPPAR
ncbi:MAG: hypothetical protein HC915_07980 [Anaerolineae bacterium]|nr:hypothetical protein [Anaerolineae bacterium]